MTGSRATCQAVVLPLEAVHSAVMNTASARRSAGSVVLPSDHEPPSHKVDVDSAEPQCRTQQREL